MANDNYNEVFAEDRQFANSTVDVQGMLRRSQQLSADSDAPPDMVDPSLPEETTGFFTVRNLHAFSNNISQIPRGMGYGVVNAAQEAVDSTYSFVEFLTGLDFEEPELPNFPEPDTPAGQIAGGITQFLTGFVPTFKALGFMGKTSKVGKALQPVMAGFIADAFFFDPYEERLANLLQSYEESMPDFVNSVTEYLAADPSDAESTARLKAGLEGVGLGMLTDGFVRSLRFVRNHKWMKDSTIGDFDPERRKFLKAAAGVGFLATPIGRALLRSPEFKGVDPLKTVVLDLGESQSSMWTITSGGEEQRIFGRVGQIMSPDEIGEYSWNLVRSQTEEETLVDGIDYHSHFTEFSGMNKSNFPDDEGGFSFIEIKHPETGETLYTVVDTNENSQQLFKGGLNDEGNPEEMLFEHFWRDEGGQQQGLEAVFAVTKRFMKEEHGLDFYISHDNKIYSEFGGEAISDLTQLKERTVPVQGSGPSAPDKVVFTKKETTLIKSARETEVGPDDVVRFLEGDASDFEEVFINFKHVKSAEDLEDVFLRTEGIFGGGAKWQQFNEVETWAQAKELAESIGMDPADIMRMQPGDLGGFTGTADVFAKKAILGQSAENVARLANRIKAGDNSDEIMAEFASSLQVHNAIQQRIKGEITQAGRILNALKKPVGASNTEHFDRLINDVVGDMTATGANRKDLRALAEMVTTLGDADAINNFTHNYKKATTIDMMYEIWMNALLSGPRTHMVNITSNALTNFWAIPERFMGAMISDLTGTQEGVVYEEAMQQIFGGIRGFIRGMKGAGEFIRTGNIDDPLTKIETIHGTSLNAEAVSQLPAMKWLSAKTKAMVPGKLQQMDTFQRAMYWLAAGTGKSIDGIGYMLRIPSTLLQAEDIVFKNVAQGREIAALSIREAKHKAALDPNVSAAEHFEYLMANPTETMLENAVKAGREATFTNELGDFGRAVQTIADNAKIMGFPVGRLIMPFVRTPINIVRFGLERTPMGILMQRNREALMKGGAEADIALAKVAMGSMVMLGTMDAVFSGFITGSAPTDPGVRDAFYRSGRQQYSIQVDGQHYSFGRLEPLGMIMGIAADMAQAAMYVEDKQEIEKIGAALVTIIGDNIGEKTFMSGLTSFFDAYTDPERSLKNFVFSMSGTLVPTGVAQYERAMMPQLSQVRSAMDKIMSRVPGWSEEIEGRLNLFGEPVYLQGGVMQEMLTPVYRTDGQYDPVDEEILRMRLNLTMPDKDIDGVELTPNQYNKFVRLASGTYEPIFRGREQATLKYQLRALMTSRGYENMPDVEKEKEVRTIVKKFRADAKEVMIADHEDLRNSILAREAEERIIGAGESAHTGSPTMTVPVQ